MTAQKAADEIATMRAVLHTLEWLRDNRNAIAVAMRTFRDIENDQTVQALRDAMPGASISDISEDTP
jgi:hypothetical protein